MMRTDQTLMTGTGELVLTIREIYRADSGDDHQRDHAGGNQLRLRWHFKPAFTGGMNQEHSEVAPYSTQFERRIS